MDDIGKLCIQGVVFCCCGNQIISNSGKTFYDPYAKELFCWGVDQKTCRLVWQATFAYSKREHGQHIHLTVEDAVVHSRSLEPK